MHISSKRVLQGSVGLSFLFAVCLCIIVGKSPRRGFYYIRWIDLSDKLNFFSIFVQQHNLTSHIQDSLPLLIPADHTGQLVQCHPGLKPPVLQQLHHISCHSEISPNRHALNPSLLTQKSNPFWNNRISQQRPCTIGRHRSSADKKSQEGLLDVCGTQTFSSFVPLLRLLCLQYNISFLCLAGSGRKSGRVTGWRVVSQQRTKASQNLGYFSCLQKFPGCLWLEVAVRVAVLALVVYWHQSPACISESAIEDQGC